MFVLNTRRVVTGHGEWCYKGSQLRRVCVVVIEDVTIESSSQMIDARE